MILQLFVFFKFEKIGKHIDFQLDKLKFNAYVDRGSPHFNVFNDFSYELSSICFHIGSQMNRGHYTCN